MKLTKRDVDDLITMILHIRKDISYGNGGTFITGETDKDGDWELDEKDLEKVLRAIGLIKTIIITK